MRALWLSLIMTVSLCGCYGMAHYKKPPDAALTDGTGAEPVKPDKFEVRPEQYPFFNVAAELKPPLPFPGSHTEMVEILKEDKWQVTHVIGSRYIIQSKEYNERQCRYLDRLGVGSAGFVNLFGTCLRDYDYGIYITPDGKINGGWELLPSDEIMAGNRYMYMSWEASKNQGWPVDAVFQPHK